MTSIDSRRVRLATLTLAAAFVILSADRATARVIWRGDFETGDLSQWSKKQSVSNDRLRVVSDPTRQGRHALAASVRQGDDPINASGNRNELLYLGEIPTSGERFYAWSTLWPDSFRSAEPWQLFTQFHHLHGGGSPPVSFAVMGETVSLHVDGRTLWTAPLDRGRWHDFIFQVKWSAGADGFVALYYDGRLVVPRVPARTLIPGTGGAYLKQGLYRKDTITFEQVIFHDGMVVATALEDVLPAAPAPTDPTPIDPTPIDPTPNDPVFDPGTEPDLEVEPGTEPVEPEVTEPETVTAKAGCAQFAIAAPALLGLIALRRRRR